MPSKLHKLVTLALGSLAIYTNATNKEVYVQ